MSEFYRDMKIIPRYEDSPKDFEQFAEEEIRKCTEGVYIITTHGIRLRISGWLYFHLNHFKLFVDEQHPTIKNKTIRKVHLPTLRDTELIIDDANLASMEYNKGLMVFGSRRLGKTITEASRILHSAVLDYGSQNVIVGNSKEDIALITAPCSFALENLNQELFGLTHITKDWKTQVVFGYKTPDNDVQKYSEILIRNTAMGTNKESLAGITPSTLVIDEVGKSDFLESFAGAVPAFTASTGKWRCLPLLTGTSGDFDKPKDAREMFTNPGSFNFLECEVPDEGKVRGLYLSGLYRYDCKKEATIEEFYESEKNRKLFRVESSTPLITIHKDLTVQISDKEWARKKIEIELDEKLQSNKIESYLKHKMYYPIISDDCFLNKSSNPFAEYIDGLIQHKKWLEDFGPKPTWVKLSELNGEIKFNISNKIPIKNFPHKEVEDLDAAIAVIDFPKNEGKYRVEIMGVDPYNTDQSVTSKSLGSCYVLRQANNDFDDPYQDTMVAWYTARPDKLETFYRNVELLAEWYNCTILHENSNGAFFGYFDQKKKGYYFVDTWRTQQEITKNTKIRATKGLAPTKNNQDFLIDLASKYFSEEIQMNGKLQMGYTRILDPLLIEELLKFKEENTDRVWAFFHALAHLFHNKKFVQTVVVKKEEIVEVPVTRNPTPFLAPAKSPFLNTRNGGSRSPFLK